MATLLVPQIVTGQTFGYFGPNGPPFRGTLSPDWAACGTGTIQSPVDFGKTTPHHPRWCKLAIDCDDNTMCAIFNNGHTIEGETEGVSTLTLDSVAYELVQFDRRVAIPTVTSARSPYSDIVISSGAWRNSW